MYHSLFIHSSIEEHQFIYLFIYLNIFIGV